jgi:hypothetical protein
MTYATIVGVEYDVLRRVPVEAKPHSHAKPWPTSPSDTAFLRPAFVPYHFTEQMQFLIEHPSSNSLPRLQTIGPNDLRSSKKCNMRGEPRHNKMVDRDLGFQSSLQ